MPNAQINPTPNCLMVAFCLFISVTFVRASQANDLYISSSTVDITPDLPVALDGQMYQRIAQQAETPVTASVVVLESREGSKSIESVVFVSCELVAIPLDLLARVRAEVYRRLPELDGNKIVMNAIHTHTSAVIRRGVYAIPKEGVTQVEAYYTFFVSKVSDSIIQTWKSRAPGSITWGLGHAKVANNRRAVYVDNSAQMYGKTNIPEFRGLEGHEDQSIDCLFFWNKTDALIAVSIDVACPAQEVEGHTAVNADYWYPVRKSLRKRFGSELCVLGWIGAAGDQSPHLMYGVLQVKSVCSNSVSWTDWMKLPAG